MLSKISIDFFKPDSKSGILLRVMVVFKNSPADKKFTFVRTLIAAPIMEEVGDGGSCIGSGTGALNLYLCEWSKGSNLEEKLAKDLRKFEGPRIKP